VSEAGTRALLWPKEHGAYFQLALPLLTALAMGRPTVASALLALACVAGFLAHESLLVLLGRRGARATRLESPTAARTLVCLGGIVLGAGLGGMSLADADARVAAVVPLALALPVGLAIARNRERTTAAEIAAAATLAAIAAPVACASGVPLRAALAALASWAITFSAGTWGVRAVIAFQKQRMPATARVLPLLVPFAGMALLGVVAPWNALAAAPVLAVALAVAARPPHPRALRRLGWGLAAATLGTAALLVAGRVAG
jgi:hypothetical protein